MFKNLSRLTLVLGAALVLSLAVSVSAYFIIDNVHITRTFFFPDRRGGLRGETRRLPDVKGEEQKIGQLVEELILGPFDIDHNFLIPQNTRLYTVMLRDKDTVYLDFSPDFVISAGKTSLNYLEIASGIKKNVSYNFPHITKIIISVDGEVLRLES